MKIIDLSHLITPDMPVYPGTDPPLFDEPTTIENNGFLEKKITLFSHTGTHIDAPAHILKNSKTLDQMDISQFIGKGCVLDISEMDRMVIKKKHLQTYQRKIESSQFVLLYSGWSGYWGGKRYFYDYPVLDDEAALWLTSFELKGIGIDMISFDVIGSNDFKIHKILLGRGFLQIENLTNLESLISQNFLFSCLPLKISSADGSPVRAIAILS